jgi:membrane associated rhomboid family serine protease
MGNIVNFKKPKPTPDRDKKTDHPPLINLPIVTKILIVAMITIHAILFIGFGDMDRAFVFLNFGFIPSIWTGNSAYQIDIYALLSPLSYMMLHGNLMHIVMNTTMLMAFGSGVEQWMGARRFFLFFVLCGLASVAVETLIHPFSQNPVIGASGALSGLFAAILILLQSQGRLPTGKYGVWPFAMFWIGLSVVFGFVGGAMTGGGQIAWAAHLGGFIGGFVLLKTRYFNGIETHMP